MKYIIAFATVFNFVCCVMQAAAQSWNLPQDITDNNTKVTFEVDSTWHLVEGKTSKLSGKVWLDKPADPKSVRALIHFPVRAFDTDGEGRDERMREVMAAESYPEVAFEALGVDGLCSPSELQTVTSCAALLYGKLTIRGVSKEVLIPINVSRLGTAFKIAGKQELKWGEYGVEDPSIFIAKLKPVVTVSFEVELGTSGLQAGGQANGVHS